MGIHSTVGIANGLDQWNQMTGDSLILLDCGITMMVIQKNKSEKRNSCVVCFLVTAKVEIACDAKTHTKHYHYFINYFL